MPFRHPRGRSGKPSRFTDGAARPARFGEGSGADRRSDWAGVFPSLLAAVAGKPESELQSALDRVIEAGLLFRQGVPPDATYLFKHALVQDAAYGTLLRDRRRALHARIADASKASFADIAENQPELLAKHCAEAGSDERAIQYWRAAGEKAVRRASNRLKQSEHFRQALALNEKQAPDEDRSLTELAILSQLGPALMSVHGWSAPEVGTAFERARIFGSGT